MEAPIGDVSFKRRMGYHTGSEYLCSFSNVVQHPLPLKIPVGKLRGEECKEYVHTHVDVGFVDLGVLAETVLALHKRLSAEMTRGSSDESGEPESVWAQAGFQLRWVGIDASAFCCAKVLVVVDMMMQGAAAESVAQVWYSAGWSSATLDAFKKGVTSVLQQLEERDKQTGEVKQWLRAWDGRTVPLSKARAAWVDRRKQSLAGIANLLRKDDRMAACHYAVSGDVEPPAVENISKSASSTVAGPPRKVSTGSVLMFAERKGSNGRSEYAIDEHFLTTLPAADLVEQRLQGHNIFTAGALLVKHRVAALAAALQSNALTVEVRHATVSSSNKSEVSYVSALKPDSMSWSNLCDYIPPPEFHRLARDCSRPSTEHFMHSMNWILDTKGAFILDYGASDRCANLHHASRGKGGRPSEGKMLREESQERLQIRQEAEASLKASLKAMRAERLLRVAPLENSMNVCDVLLAQRMLPKWLEALSAAAPRRGRGAVVQCSVLQGPEYWPFTRTFSVVHFMLQYQ